MNRICFRIALLITLAVGLAGLSGCGDAATQPSTQNTGRPQSLPTIKMPLGKQTFELEVATEDATREIGLMHRDSMPADHGMIFAFATEQKLDFWMKNTHIPLDILYIDQAGTIVAIKPMKAYDLSSVSSDKPAKYAIELNLGVAATTGLHVGDHLNIPAEITAAAR